MLTTALRGRALPDDDDDVDLPPRRRWPMTLALTLVVALLLGGGIVVWFTPVLGVRSVEVTGAGAAELSARVQQAAAVPIGTPMLRVDLAAVRSRVAAVGPVASAAVSRRWPGTLVVAVTARTALAVTQADGRWWLVDATGKPFEPVAEPPTGLLPIALATPGEGDPATTAALGVLASLTPAIRQEVTGIVAPAPYNISLTLTGGRTVIWGGNTDDATKVAVLPALLQQPGTTFDITDPTFATVR